MRHLPLSLALCLGFVASSVACGPETHERTPMVLERTGDAEAGAPLYATHCASCHAEDGTGTPQGPNLPNETNHHSDEEIVEAILSGKGTMPAFDDDLGDQDVADLLAFLRTLE